MLLSPHIFREYDIRGTVGEDLTEEFAHLLGRAYATLARENGKNTIAIGYDCRLSSPSFARSLGRGMCDEGLDAVLIGMCPTPQLYYAVNNPSFRFGGGIQVTGSHNPPEMNGFKICLGTNTLASDDIQDLRRRMTDLLKNESTSSKGKISEQDITSTYIAELVENCRPHLGARKLKIVVDAGNGVGGLVGPEVLRRLGAEVIELFCEPDGRFPNHHPDPTVLENITELIAAVRANNADFGIGWDGDADRIAVVDEAGKVIFGDMLSLIYARAILREVPKATVVADVKCSSLLFDDITARGGRAVMWKTGHSLIKKKLRELNGELGAEMSGHIVFKHRYYGFDDALYCSARLLELMSNVSGPISGLLADLPKMISTPEIRVDCPEKIKFRIPEAAKASFSGYDVTTIDGVRVTFADGWGLVRASNTQPVLVMRFEAHDQAALARIQGLVTEKIEEIKKALSSKGG